jgi:F-type H+-transporting ATPase subunit a
MHGESEGISVALKSDILFNFLGLPITNTFITSLLLSFLLIFFVIFIIKKSDLRPSKLQLVIEFFIAGGYDFTKQTLNNDNLTKKVYPLIASLFFVILFFNLTKFIPGMESITFGEHHLFKPVHSDLNMTLALSIVSFIVIQALGILVLGF